MASTSLVLCLVPLLALGSPPSNAPAFGRGFMAVRPQSQSYSLSSVQTLSWSQGAGGEIHHQLMQETREAASNGFSVDTRAATNMCKDGRCETKALRGRAPKASDAVPAVKLEASPSHETLSAPTSLVSDNPHVQHTCVGNNCPQPLRDSGNDSSQNRPDFAGFMPDEAAHERPSYLTNHDAEIATEGAETEVFVQMDEQKGKKSHLPDEV